MSLNSNHSQTISNRTSHSIKISRGVALETIQTSEGIVEEEEAEVTVALPGLVAVATTTTRISSINPNSDSQHLETDSHCLSRLGTIQINHKQLNLYQEVKAIKVTFLQEVVLTIPGEASIIKTREVEIQIIEEEEVIIIPSTTSNRTKVAVVALETKTTSTMPTSP